MIDRIVRCTVCGTRAGSASNFRRGRCSDCQESEARRRGTRTALAHIVLFVAAVYALVDGVTGPLSFLLVAIAFYDILFAVMTVVHEAAHAMIALLFGFGVREVSIGMGPRVATWRLGGTRVVLNLYPVGGHTLTMPSGDHIRPKLFAVMAAGPLSHIPFAAWLFTLSTGNEFWDILFGNAPWLVMVYLVVNVIPVIENDGLNMARLFTMPDEELATLASAVASLEELIPILDDPAANPASPSQREAILAHLATPGLSKSDRALHLNNLAVVDVLLEDSDLLREADEASRDAYALMPDSAAIRNTRGSVMILTGDYAKGIALVQATLARVPREALGESHLDLAFAHAMLGHAFEGRDHLFAADGHHTRPRLYDITLEKLGSLECEVMRGFAERNEEAAATAARFREQAGPQASVTGKAIQAHITATGADGDLLAVARALAPERRPSQA